MVDGFVGILFDAGQTAGCCVPYAVHGLFMATIILFILGLSQLLPDDQNPFWD